MNQPIKLPDTYFANARTSQSGTQPWSDTHSLGLSWAGGTDSRDALTPL